jgi:hypothetical protein
MPEGKSQFGMRKFYSQLNGLCSGSCTRSWVEECNSMPAWVAGRYFAKPDLCEESRFWPGVWGYFYIQDSTCLGYYGTWKMNECTASNPGKRKVSAVIYRKNDQATSWEAVCKARNTSVLGLDFPAPQASAACVSTILATTWGEFNIYDISCNVRWGSFQADSSCSNERPGHRRYAAVLYGIVGDWDAVCRVTGAVIKGMKFDQPERCEWSVTHEWGVFFVPDLACNTCPGGPLAPSAHWPPLPVYDSAAASPGRRHLLQSRKGWTPFTGQANYERDLLNSLGWLLAIIRATIGNPRTRNTEIIVDGLWRATASVPQGAAAPADIAAAHPWRPFELIGRFEIMFGFLRAAPQNLILQDGPFAGQSNTAVHQYLTAALNAQPQVALPAGIAPPPAIFLAMISSMWPETLRSTLVSNQLYIENVTPSLARNNWFYANTPVTAGQPIDITQNEYAQLYLNMQMPRAQGMQFTQGGAVGPVPLEAAFILGMQLAGVPHPHRINLVHQIRDSVFADSGQPDNLYRSCAFHGYAADYTIIRSTSATDLGAGVLIHYAGDRNALLLVIHSVDSTSVVGSTNNWSGARVAPALGYTNVLAREWSGGTTGIQPVSAVRNGVVLAHLHAAVVPVDQIDNYLAGRYRYSPIGTFHIYIMPNDATERVNQWFGHDEM